MEIAKHKAVYIRKTDKFYYLMIFFIGNFRDGSHHEYWKTVMKIPLESVEEAKDRIRRIKIVRTMDIRKKSIDYLRFTRCIEYGTQYSYYLNGKKIESQDLPVIVEKIYNRRTARHNVGKSSQLDEEVVFTMLDERILDIDFPTVLVDPRVKSPERFKMNKENVPLLIPKRSGRGLRRNARSLFEKTKGGFL